MWYYKLSQGQPMNQPIGEPMDQSMGQTPQMPMQPPEDEGAEKEKIRQAIMKSRIFEICIGQDSIEIMTDKLFKADVRIK